MLANVLCVSEHKTIRMAFATWTQCTKHDYIRQMMLNLSKNLSKMTRIEIKFALSHDFNSPHNPCWAQIENFSSTDRLVRLLKAWPIHHRPWSTVHFVFWSVLPISSCRCCLNCPLNGRRHCWIARKTKQKCSEFVHTKRFNSNFQWNWLTEFGSWQSPCLRL